MKKLSTILLIAMFSVPAFSQFLSFGIKAGAESSTTPKYYVTNPFNILSIEAAENFSWGFHGGIFTRVKVFNLFIQPEIVFASNSFDYEINWIPMSASITSQTMIKSTKFNRLSVPLLVGMKFGPLRLNAGPAANVLIGTPKDFFNDINFNGIYKSAVWGYQAGIGFDILKKLTLDARYAGSLGKKFGDSVTIGSQNFKLDHSQKSFLLSVGFMF